MLWLAVLRKRIDRKLQYLVVALVACTLANFAIEEAGAYLIPLDIAGTPPPDPRNTALRVLITAAVQLPVSLVLAYYLARILRK